MFDDFVICHRISHLAFKNFNDELSTVQQTTTQQKDKQSNLLLPKILNLNPIFFFIRQDGDQSYQRRTQLIDLLNPKLHKLERITFIRQDGDIQNRKILILSEVDTINGSPWPDHIQQTGWIYQESILSAEDQQTHNLSDYNTVIN